MLLAALFIGNLFITTKHILNLVYREVVSTEYFYGKQNACHVFCKQSDK